MGAYIILLISMNKNHLREVAQHRHWLPDLLTLRPTSLCSGSTKLLSQVCLSPRMVGPFRNRPIQISAQTTSPNQSSPEPQFWWSWCPVLLHKQTKNKKLKLAHASLGANISHLSQGGPLQTTDPKDRAATTQQQNTWSMYQRYSLKHQAIGTI